MNLYEACVAALEKPRDPDVDEDPFETVRKLLRLGALRHAVRLGKDPLLVRIDADRTGQFPNAQWLIYSTYVERHRHGVRFMLRDPEGREVDLSELPEPVTVKKEKKEP